MLKNKVLFKNTYIKGWSTDKNDQFFKISKKNTIEQCIKRLSKFMPIIILEYY